MQSAVGASVRSGRTSLFTRVVHRRLSGGNPSWHVMELKSSDLVEPSEVVDRIRKLCQDDAGTRV